MLGAINGARHFFIFSTISLPFVTKPCRISQKLVIAVILVVILRQNHADDKPLFMIF